MSSDGLCGPATAAISQIAVACAKHSYGECNCEPTQAEIDGVAAVFEKVADDPIANQSAYIMAKMLKRVFVLPKPPR